MQEASKGGAFELTNRQAEIYAFMREYFADNDQLPSIHAISNRFGMSSTNAASDHLKAMIHRGAVERNAAGKLRFARLKGELPEPPKFAVTKVGPERESTTPRVRQPQVNCLDGWLRG